MFLICGLSRICPLIALLLVLPCFAGASDPVRFGAYYFDGWSGKNPASDDASQTWAKDAPTHLTKRLVEEFPGREPIWGWRDDTMPIMEQQINLAADNGLDFFAFCWYWRDNKGPINEKAIEEDPKQTGLNLFIKAPNNGRMQFCLLVANHGGAEIIGEDAWKEAADYWIKYFKHPRYLKADGKPLIIIFSPGKADAKGLSYLQKAAKKAGLPGVSVASCGTLPPETEFTHSTRYNAIPPLPEGSPSLEMPYSSIAPYAETIWNGDASKLQKKQHIIPIVTAGWDKRPWEETYGQKKAGRYFPDRTPEAFASLLRQTASWMDAHPDEVTKERLAIIYAWNEFGEGGYIAPTKDDPDGAYLKALKASAEGPR